MNHSRFSALIIMLFSLLFLNCESEIPASGSNDDPSETALPKLPSYTISNAFEDGSALTLDQLNEKDAWLCFKASNEKPDLKIIDVFAEHLNAKGFVPNEEDARSENPGLPYFSLLMQEIKKSSPLVLKRNLGAMIKSYQFWMDGFIKLKNEGDFKNRVIQVDRKNLLNVYQDSSFIDLELNCLLYHLEKSIAEGLALLNQEDKAAHYEGKAFSRKNTILKFMWDEESNNLHNYYVQGFIDSTYSWNMSAYPLYFDLLPKDKAAELFTNVMEQLSSPEVQSEMIRQPHELLMMLETNRKFGKGSLKNFNQNSFNLTEDQKGLSNLLRLYLRNHEKESN